jgi:DNA invertase Pin-like site-specific DNA recombinase
VKLIGYLRRSKDENGNGLSLQAQRTHIQRYAEATDHEIVEWLEDVASGRDMDRPGMRTALAMLAADQADGLAVAKLDRASRSVTDFGLLLETATKQGWSFIAIDLGVDTSTASGELVVNVLMAIARWERRAIGERTSAALQQKKRSGQRLGRPVQLPDSTRQTIRRYRDKGLTCREIADRLNRRHIPTATGTGRWYAQRVRKVYKSLEIDDQMRELGQA